ncbi:PD40 domain-containing protein [Tumebacillus sp. ITR2]|uniref:PD40 domain-containing protein n=1 Tax=Tumebacillus amylolyticus TaxID=2801339 RepID=A0ABS1J6Q9_9BACL|nr:PD40 domain-containing protein [Tumebacillus amylolyticus]MBL0385944.1 PD40 domain-containing protein [Tumebacillus amylolyticus]
MKRLMLLLFAICLSLGCGGGGRFGEPTEGLGEDFAISPDDRHIAYTTVQNGVSSLYIANVDGTGVTRLSQSDKASYLQPRFSSDGSKILFVSMPVKSKLHVSTLQEIHADGSGLKLLSGGDTLITEALYARDDKTIYYVQSQRFEEKASYRPVDLDLYSMEATGANRQRITKLAHDTMEHLSLSDDGTSLLYQTIDPTSYETRFRVLSLNKKLDMISFLPPHDPDQQLQDPSWLPGPATGILYSADVQQKQGDVPAFELFTMDLPSKTVRQITRLDNASLKPIALHHSPAVLFLKNKDKSRQKNQYVLMQVQLDGSGAKEIPLQP